jgi:phosphoribosylanthranilate isomerase
MFARVQLNFHTEPHGILAGLDKVLEAGDQGKAFILQCDGVHDEAVYEQGRRHPGVVSPLFDLSGGAGVLPVEWPPAWSGVRCGYAGGLGPANVAEQLARIERAAPGASFWIDMERRVRSEDDSQFDLKKVRKVLEQIQWRQS